VHSVSWSTHTILLRNACQVPRTRINLCDGDERTELLRSAERKKKEAGWISLLRAGLERGHICKSTLVCFRTVMYIKLTISEHDWVLVDLERQCGFVMT